MSDSIVRDSMRVESVDGRGRSVQSYGKGCDRDRRLERARRALCRGAGGGGRFGEARDLDGTLLLLASDAGRFITGTTMVVDGGQLVVLRG